MEYAWTCRDPQSHGGVRGIAGPAVLPVRSRILPFPALPTALSLLQFQPQDSEQPLGSRVWVWTRDDGLTCKRVDADGRAHLVELGSKLRVADNILLMFAGELLQPVLELDTLFCQLEGGGVDRSDSVQHKPLSVSRSCKSGIEPVSSGALQAAHPHLAPVPVASAHLFEDT
eukprot:2432296-Rhodomonas_salina.2